MRNKSKWTAALLALAACGGAFAGEGNSATDRSNQARAAQDQSEQAKYLPLICRTGENAVAVPQADGSLQWRCSSVSVASAAPAD